MALRVSLVAASRGYSPVAVCGLLTKVASFVVEAQQLWRTGLVALRHMGASQTRDAARVPCAGRWILNHQGSPAPLIF